MFWKLFCTGKYRRMIWWCGSLWVTEYSMELDPVYLTVIYLSYWALTIYNWNKWYSYIYIFNHFFFKLLPFSFFLPLVMLHIIGGPSYDYVQKIWESYVYKRVGGGWVYCLVLSCLVLILFCVCWHVHMCWFGCFVLSCHILFLCLCFVLLVWACYWSGCEQVCSFIELKTWFLIFYMKHCI